MIEEPLDASISIRGLSKVFRNGTRALDDVSLDIASGETVVLLGANGSGKSTLQKCITRLIEPTEGTITVFGREITEMDSRRLAEVRRDIGVVFQSINLVDQLTVLTNVIHGALGRDGSPRNWFAATAKQQLREEAMTALERVGLTAVADRRAEQLSGGQRQRVAIARTLMQRPSIVLADEPVAALDPVAGRGVMDLLWRIAEEEGLTLVCTLHQLALARDHGRRVVALRDGRVDVDADIAELDDARLEGLYIAEEAGV
ncbi:phosphonate ABC transporter ATP-binding protein [Nesterenkonia aerolata]|uniref:Phosphonate ABC transporter ATP-binding protein n=1 Tax=Nesterenkonia aerolata TaxID=3074079 RepID=A0ABU2DRB0_9MICC|nr:phosphonate ABC transporter ATP-binding protein [Nesterenkonia sp. LY-0111]MDR8019033.1 phosphonate ABC transporter ATP-binding protein [Nesterenkonia sp. LY-0111]